MTETEHLDKNYDLAIVIPTLNEEKGLASTINSIKKSLDSKFSYKIVVVDGFSNDNTVAVAKSNGAKVISQRRKGYGDALQAGFYFVDTKLQTDITVMLDADGTYETADILKMAEIIKKGDADFVIGNRFADMDKKAMTGVNKFGNKFLSAIARKLLHLSISDTQCGIRAFRSDLADIFYTTSLGMPFATEMLTAINKYQIRYKEIPTSYHERIGETKLNPIQDGFGILSTIVRLMRDTRPLAFFSSIGILMLAIGFFFGIQVLIEYFETSTVTKLPTTILSVLFIVLGIQSISLGLISDMIKNTTADKRIFFKE